ncbi:ACY1.2 family protein [Megaselia abdita]
MGSFVHTEEFKEMNVGVSLDEGAPWPTPVSPLFYGERTTWQIHFKFHGQAGHGCIIHKNTAAEKFHYVVSKFLEYRGNQAKRLADNPKTLHMGDVTAVNLTKIQGGVQVNVVPSLLEAWVDCRIAVDVDLTKFQEQVEKWCKEAGDNVEVIWCQQQEFVPPTKIDDSNKFWVALKKSFEELNIKVDPQICPGGTDSKYLRRVGVSSFGYSPMPNTKILLHDHDEYEEIGGLLGMKVFVQTKEFKSMNVGFALDEGCSSLSNVSPIYYAERTKWEMNFKFEGTTGHGSILHDNTAAEKFFYVMGKFCEFRESEKNKLKSNPSLTLADVTSVNITIVKGGVLNNVVPSVMEASIDCRVAIDVDLIAFENKIRGWCNEAGDGVHLSFSNKDPLGKPTKIDNSNPFWTAMMTAFEQRNLKVNPEILFAITDMRHIRAEGIPAFGYSPMKNTPILVHCHDEYLKVETYLEGIDTYKAIISNVANV